MPNPQTLKNILERAAALVEKRPDIGQRDHASSACVKNGLHCSVEEKGWELYADVPVSMGGQNIAPSPSTLFRASVSSCVAIGIRMWAARMDVAIDTIDVTFTTRVDARGQFGVSDDTAPGFESASLDIHLTSDATSEDISCVVETSLRYSAMMDAIRGRFPVDTRISISKLMSMPEGAA
ncbi:OsmC family protein [Hyphomonas sp.]|uniref:OsmC family protein n=1 Tax=Hyphomonas sp. TaxID=87 RepID=UPI003D2D077F